MMALFSRNTLVETTAALFAQHQIECGERYKETARQLERLTDSMERNNRAVSARFWAAATMALSALGYIILTLLHGKGIL